MSDEALAGGEEVLFEARAHGRPPFDAGAITTHATLLFVAALLTLAAWLSVRDLPTWKWSLGLGTIQFSGADPARGITSSSAGAPSPLAFVVLMAAVELGRFALWRSQRVLVTARRVIVTRGVLRTAATTHARQGRERVTRPRGTVVLEGVDPGPADLGWLDEGDAQSLAKVLGETFDATPLPPPRPPFWTRRRATALLAVLFLSALAGALVRFHRPVALSAERKGVAGGWSVLVTLDSPAFGARAARGLSVERILFDGKPAPSSSWSVGMSGGAIRSTRERRHDYVRNPATPEPARVRIEGKVTGGDGVDRPFAVELGPGDDVSIPLGD